MKHWTYKGDNMKKFKVAVEGYMVLEVEANSIEEAENNFYDSPAHENSEMFSTEIREIVPVDEDFKNYTDLN